MTDQIAEAKIKVTLDGSGVKSDVAETVNSIDGIGKAAERAGIKGSKGIEKLADGAQTASTKIDKATNNIKNSIERTIATINAGGRGTSSFFEALINTRGADPAILKPYIEQLKAAEKAADQAAIANAKLGNTAKQTAFALRNVPAQFSDIFVSLQAGQAPLTVFLQQGAQLKDLFGGAGAAARALGGYLIGLVNPFTLAAGAVGGLGAAYYAGSEQSERLTRALLISGNAAGQSQETLENLAQKAGALSGSYGTAREAVEALATSGQISGNVLESALIGVVSGSQLTGRAVKELVADFESIGKSPVKAIVDLNQKYNFLTLEVYKQIEALEKQGKTQEAATLATKTYADTLNNRQAEMLKNIGAIERGWLNVKAATSSALDAVIGIGRESTPADAAAKAIAESTERLAKLRSAGVGGGTFGSDAEIERERQTLLLLTKANAERQAREVLEGQRSQREKQQISNRDTYNKLVSDPNNQSKKQAEESKIAEINTKFNAQLALYEKGTEEYKKLVQARDQAISNVREKASAADNKSAQSAMEKLANAFTTAKDRAEDFIRTQQAQLAQETTVSAAQKLSAELLDLISDKKIKLNGVEQKTLESYAQQILKLDELNIAHEQELKFYDDFEKALVNSQNAFDQQIESISKNAEQLEIENAVFGKMPSAITEVTLARLRDRKAIIEGLGLAADDIERQIEAYERLRAAQTNKEFLEKEKEINEERKREAKKVADDILKTNQKMAEDINKSITDALLRGFEDGKSFAKNFRDTLVNMFKTLVLRPVINMVLNSSGITKALGGVGSIFSGNALAGESTTGATSIFGQLSSIGDIFKLGNNSIVSSIESLGAIIANGNGGLLDSIGGFIGANSSILSDGLGYAGAVLQLAQGNIGGAIGAGLGTALGGPIGGAIGSFLGGAVGGLFGGDSLPPRVTESRRGKYENGVFTSTDEGLSGKRTLGASAQLDGINEAFSKSLSSYLAAFDIQQVIGTVSLLTKKKNTRAGFYASLDGESVGGFYDSFGKKGSFETAFNSLVEKAMGEVMVKAIQASSVSESIKSLFDGFSKKDEVLALMNATALLNQAQNGLIDKYAITTDKAAEVAKATGLLGTALSDFVTRLATAGLTIGDQLINQRQGLIEDIGGLPNNLRAFDNLLKGIDKSSAAGIEQFTDLFNIRDQFIAYTNSLSTLRSGVDSALLNIVSDGDKQAILQTNLARAFDDVGVAIPATIDELITLGKSIDFTTAAGLNLASVFPSLVSAFTQAKDVIDSLSNSARAMSSFSTAEDYNYYSAVSAQYGGQFASDFTANLEAARIVNDVNGKAVIEADPTLSVVEEVKMLRTVSEAQAISLGRMTRLLEKFDVDGLAARVD